jgi:16S rRNA (guanine527-N7)-methyltransferase
LEKINPWKLLMQNELNETSAYLNELLAGACLEPLPPELARGFGEYLSLILRWNARMNLTAVRDPDEILSRHFVECIAVARALPAGIHSLLDFGSGAGLPGIPIALCRSEIAVTLAESQGKKAAFLQEAVRVLGLTARVHAGRVEEIAAAFDCVTLRAVDKMEEAIKVAAGVVRPAGWLALMVTSDDSARLASCAGDRFSWTMQVAQPGSESRMLALGQRMR